MKNIASLRLVLPQNIVRIRSVPKAEMDLHITDAECRCDPYIENSDTPHPKTGSFLEVVIHYSLKGDPCPKYDVEIIEAKENRTVHYNA